MILMGRMATSPRRLIAVTRRRPRPSACREQYKDTLAGAIHGTTAAPTPDELMRIVEWFQMADSIALRLQHVPQ